MAPKKKFSELAKIGSVMALVLFVIDLYYDGALRDVDFDDQGVRFEIKRWYE